MQTNRRLRIAVLNRFFSPSAGGAERYSIALVEELAQRHEIHVFAQQIEHAWPGVTYHRIGIALNKPRWINQLWYATRTWWLTRRGFDVVHSHENTWHGQVQTVHVLPVKYTLFQGRTGWRRAMRCLKIATSPRLLTYLWLELMRFSNPSRRRIVVTSNSLMTRMAITYPATAPFLRLVTPGVKRADGAATPTRRRQARQSLHLPQLGNAILFVGNDYRKKGLGTLIKALAQLPQDTWLAVVGDVAQIPEFGAQAKAAKVDARIFFLGPLQDVSEAYIAADCLAHPTLEDTFAMVVLEAMANGLPVVVSSERYCGIAGLLVHEINALILDNPQDSRVLADALRQLSQQPALGRRLGDAARAFADTHRWSALALQQEEIYFSLFSNRQ